MKAPSERWCLFFRTLLWLPALATASWAQTFRITTVAGLAEFGGQDGIGAAARFREPAGLTVDGEGNLYVAERENHAIRKITPGGVVTTLAGTAGNSGAVDGVGSEARFYEPTGVAVDAAGNFYVADSSNYCVRKITPTGVVTTFAGRFKGYGTRDGTAPEASFLSPDRIAIDSAGNLHVADGGNLIRRISPAGAVSTLAGRYPSNGNVNGTGTAASFSGISDLVVDRAGVVYVFCHGAIRKVTPDGVVTTLAGSAGAWAATDGAGTAARFSLGGYLAVDREGDLYVADLDNHTIRKVTPTGVVSTLAGSARTPGHEDGVGGTARFRYPTGIAVDAAGILFVSDTKNHTIRQISSAGVVTTIAGVAAPPGHIDAVGTNARFNGPSGVALDREGSAYVADSGSRTIRKVTRAGQVTTVAGTPSTSLWPTGDEDGIGPAARFLLPSAIAFDGRRDFYVFDWTKVRKVTPDGVVTSIAGGGPPGSADGQGSAAGFSYSSKLAVDGEGNIFIADYGNRTIRKVTPEGLVTTLAGASGQAGDADGIGSAARFGYPTGIAVDRDGSLIVTELVAHNPEIGARIRRVTPAGVVTTLAKDSGAYPEVDGPLAVAGLSYPSAPVVDRVGNIFFSEYCSLRKISTQGYVSTVAGQRGIEGSVDGVGADARFYYPQGIAIDDDGSLVIADGTDTIRRGTPAYPILTAVPNSQFVAAAAATVLTVVAEGSDLTYQWRKDRVALPGQTTARLELKAATAADTGFYAVTVTNRGYQVESPVAILTVATGVTGELKNLAVRGVAGSTAETLIVGFALQGSGVKTVLLRGVGPGLAPFGVSNVLADPVLSLANSAGTVIGQNDNWGGNAAVAAAAIQTGAFPLLAASLDAALLPSLAAGSYTAQMGGGAGAAMLEVYDAGGGSAVRLANLSARSRSGSDGDALTAGFVISGAGPCRVLVRGVGPALGSFGVAGAMNNPRLRLFRGATVVAENEDWTTPSPGVTASALSRVFAEAGAFALSSWVTKDAALVVTLPPGAYTAQVDSANGAGGVALIEIYALPLPR